MTMRRRCCTGLATIAVVLCAAPAAAHPRVDEGRRRVAEADFDAAERAFAAAETSTDLDRDDVISLLEGRALLAHALQDRQRMETELRRLAALDPAHTFAAQLPPELAATFTRIRGGGIEPLDIVTDARREGGTVFIAARVRGDPGGLVREVRVHARIAGGAWRTTTQPGNSAPAELVLDAAPDADVELYAVAIGPGAAPLAESGTANAPVVVPPAGATAAPVAGGTTVDLRTLGQDLRALQQLGEDLEEDEDSTTFTINGWVLLAVGVVITGIALGIYFAIEPPESDFTRPSAPAIAGF